MAFRCQSLRTEANKEFTMTKTYKIEVDCANCAAKMEEAAKKTAGVKNATVNFMLLKMTVDFEDGADEKKVMKDVLKNCKKVEDDCEADHRAGIVGADVRATSMLPELNEFCLCKTRQFLRTSMYAEVVRTASSEGM